MTKALAALLILFYAILTGCSGARTLRTDAVEVADSANDARAGQAGYDKATSAFLVDAADARMMDIKEGRIAVKKGASPAVRIYGQTMVKEQTSLLTSIRRIARSRHITLPTDISNSKKEGFSQLAELDGDGFDEKFIKMMIIDHERDVKEFTTAQTLGDSSVAAFAFAKLPQIRTHLAKIEAIRDQRKK